MTDKIIKALKISPKTELRLTTGWYEGKEWFSFRLWTHSKTSQAWIATPRGITLERKFGKEFFGGLLKNDEITALKHARPNSKK